MFILTVAAMIWGGQANVASMEIDDLYYGGAKSGASIFTQPDVIGGYDHYDVTKMEVNITLSNIQVDIYSKYFDNIGEDHTNLGDFFISTDDWTPFGSASDNYNMDVAANGEDWEYVLVFDYIDGSKTSGDLFLYEVDESKLIYANNQLTPSGYRPGQEILYNADRTSSGSLAQGTWSISGLGEADTDDYLSLSIGNSIGLNIEDFAMRWTMTCANDIIEGGSPVPEPATMLLFSTGLFGLVGTALRRKKR